jgi:cation diffusion facilitator CzcD-associated flavoprotein CzcO
VEITMQTEPVREVVVIGAGFAGIAALHHAKQQGFDAVLVEAAPGIGGTWYWNSYPDARTDTEAWYYSYSFAPEVIRRWRWKERFPARSEVKGFLEFVAAELDLLPSMMFDARVEALEYDESAKCWTVVIPGRPEIRTRFVVTAVGGLSAPVVPDIPGIEKFTGEVLLSSRWATDGVDLRGKRVGVIGTGSTGVQIITAIAPVTESLYVLQRTPNYVLPRNNHTISDEQWRGTLQSYDDIWNRIRNHYFAYPLELTGRCAVEASEAERAALFEQMWHKGGFSMFLEAFDDLATDAQANAYAADFIRAKIRQAVADPVVADLLTPKGYPFGGKRPVVGSGYYETFNRSDVHLVDVRDSGVAIADDGSVAAGGTTFALDTLIMATGFDAGTGALAAIDVRGVGGVRLDEVWKAGTRTHLGICTAGFPNLLYVYGPQTPYANQPPCVEWSSEWVVGLLEFMRERGLDEVEGSPEVAEDWARTLVTEADATVFTKTADQVRPWFMGTNVEGKAKEVAVYFGGSNRYYDLLHGIRADSYKGFEFR